MFENYPDVVEVDDLRKMLGGISRKLAYRLLADQEIRSVRVGRAYKIPGKSVILNTCWVKKCVTSTFDKTATMPAALQFS